MELFLVRTFGYHLVMTKSLPWKDPPFFIGKPSFSMGHFRVSHGYVSHNQVGYFNPPVLLDLDSKPFVELRTAHAAQSFNKPSRAKGG
jgi:hypothetical protein